MRSGGWLRRASRPARPSRRWPGVNANLLFTWRRREARSAASGGAEPWKLVPVRVEDEWAPDALVAALEPVGRMEIVLAAGERILVGADVDAAALARVVKALSRR
jgi:transposase